MLYTPYPNPLAPTYGGMTGTDYPLAIDNTVGALLLAAQQSGPKNLLMNPDFQIDQVNEGALYTVNAATVQAMDGWSGAGVVAAGVFKMRRFTEPNFAFMKAMEISCTTIDASPLSTSRYYVFQNIEGFDIASLPFGVTPLANMYVTITFQFQTNVLGFYGVSLHNGAGNRCYVDAINVVNTGSNTYVISAQIDTTGTWAQDNTTGLQLAICLSPGSTFTTATTQAWQAGNFFAPTTNVNFMSNIANLAYLSRAALVDGPTLMGLRPADYAEGLRKCQRYAWKTFNQGIAVAQSSGSQLGAIGVNQPIAAAVTRHVHKPHPVSMRAAPTYTFYNPNAANALWRNVTGAADSGAASANEIGTDGANITNAGAAADAANSRAIVHAYANARLS